MDDVAARAGVSKAAVSKVIRNAYGVSPAMRERVEAAILDLGYRPHVAARSMRGSSYTIGFEIPQLDNDFFTHVMQGAADALTGSGYQLIIAPGVGGISGTQVLDALVDRRVDGIVAISPEVTPERLEQIGLEVPLVLLGRHDSSVNYDTLTNDDRMGTQLVMDHLLGLGHWAIAHTTLSLFAGVPQRLLPHDIRRRGYEAAMEAQGLTPRIAITEPFEPDAYRVTSELLSGPDRPTAIFAGNDTLAVGALRARADLCLDGEVSIVGYDNIDLAAHPVISLTTVDQFAFASGSRAIRLLLERIQRTRTESVHEMVQPVLRVRGSSRPASSQTP
jgi:LacI family transcriptional regulator